MCNNEKQKKRYNINQSSCIRRYLHDLGYQGHYARRDIFATYLFDKIAKTYLRQNNLVFVQISTYCLIFIWSNFDSTYEYCWKDLRRLSSWDKQITCLDKNGPSRRWSFINSVTVLPEHLQYVVVAVKSCCYALGSRISPVPISYVECQCR